MKLVGVCLFVICLAGCKKSKPQEPPAVASGSAPSPDAASLDALTPATPDAAAPDEAMDCDMACTELALCWEAVNPGEMFQGGGQCVRACEDRAAEDRAEWLASVAAAKPDARCKILMEE